MTTPRKPPTGVNPMGNYIKARNEHYGTEDAVKPVSEPTPVPEQKKTTISEVENSPINKNEGEYGVTGGEVTLTPETIESTLSALRDATHYRPNPFHQFTNVAYHARLFMTVDRDISQKYYPDFDAPDSVQEYFDKLDKFKQVTIAETGATSFNIENFQIESLVGPNFQSVALNSNSIVMNIKEPSGVRFLDALKQAALTLKSRDIRRTWLYLELTFRGYDDAGEPLSNLLVNEGLDNGGRWIWRVQVTDIETKLSASGGEYKLSMVPYDETAYDADSRAIPDLLIAEGDTIKEFFDDLADGLNKAWKIRSGEVHDVRNGKYIGYRSYSFVFHGIKGKNNVSGETVEGFRLRPADKSGMTYIRDMKMERDETVASVPDSTTSATSEAVPTVAKSPTPATPPAKTLRTLPNIVAVGNDAKAQGLRVSENAAFGGVRSEHKGTGHAQGRAIDINYGYGTNEASSPAIRKKLDRLAVKYQNAGYVVLWNGKRYDPSGNVTPLKRGAHQHRDHMHVEAPSGSGRGARGSSTSGSSGSDEPQALQYSPLSGKPRGQFARGSSIDEIVTAVFQCSPEAVRLIKDSMPDNTIDEDTSIETGKVNGNGFRESVIFRLEPEVVVKHYDPIFGGYGKHIIYHVYGYVTQRPILSRVQIEQAKETDVQKRMLTSLVKNDLLNKRYDYIFTGLNSDVIDFDCSFNLTWTAALPRMLRNEALQAQSLYEEDLIEDYKDGLDYAQQVTEAANAINSAREDIDSAQTEEELAEASTKYNEAVDKSLEIRERADAIRERLMRDLPEINEEDLVSGDRGFAEDIAYVPPLNDISVMMSHSFEEARQATIGGMVSQPTQGAAIFGTVVNQLQGPMSSQMITISLEIMGDPYWIGPSNMEKVVLLRKKEETTNMAKFSVGDNVFILTFRYPLGTDEDGDPQLEENEFFTGVYSVTKVTHKFADGKFTQTLSAMRMNLLNLYKAMEDGGEVV